MSLWKQFKREICIGPQECSVAFVCIASEYGRVGNPALCEWPLWHLFAHKLDVVACPVTAPKNIGCPWSLCSLSRVRLRLPRGFGQKALMAFSFWDAQIVWTLLGAMIMLLP